MKFLLAALALAALGACASSQIAEAPPAAPSFDASACYERRFAVYYEQWDSALDVEAQEVIAAMDNSLRGCRIDHVRIVGLAGALGPDDANLALSQQRAETLADYLAAHTSWPRSAYEIVARGEEGATTDDGTPRPMRRRARVTVTASAP